MSEHRDPVVADALRRLDVPDHHPDFWAALDVALRDESGPERGSSDESGSDATVVQLRESAERRVAERRRTPMVTLAAAVAVVVALVVGAAVLAGGGDGREATVDIADDPAEGPAEEASDTSLPGESADTTMPEVPPRPGEPAAMTAEEAEARASEWLDRLLAGDIEAAYRLLDDRSREAMTLDEFQQVGAGLVEGAAAFAGDGIERDVTGLGAFHVVTFTGDVQREAMVETDSYPVVVTGTGVHFALDGPQLELPGSTESSGLTLTSPLVVEVAEGSDAWIWFDGGEPEPLAGRGRVTIDLEEAPGAGTHVVSLVAAQGDAITARAYTVVVP